jgi:hypothetical protein
MAESDQDQLRQINLGIAAWEQKRDEAAIAKLDQILSPQLVFRRADGTVVGKAEFMAGLRAPSPFTARESGDAAVEVRGDRALAVVTVTTTAADGTVGRYRNVRMFARRGRRWQLEFWFNDDITRASAPRADPRPSP